MAERYLRFGFVGPRSTVETSHHLTHSNITATLLHTMNRNDLNGIGFHWIHAVFARTYDVPKSMKILDEAIVLHIIAFVFFFSRMPDEAHNFSLDAWSARSVLLLPESIASSADIWYSNGLCRRRYLTWDSKWMIPIDAVNGIVWVVNGRWKWIESRNIRIQFPVTHKLLQFTYAQVHINSNGLRTNSMKLEKHIIFLGFVFASKKNAEVQIGRLHFTASLDDYSTLIRLVHYWRVFCVVFALMPEASSIWHLSHFSAFVFAPVLNEREGGKLNEN